jgi:hypothetical protein
MVRSNLDFVRNQRIYFLYSESKRSIEEEITSMDNGWCRFYFWLFIVMVGFPMPVCIVALLAVSLITFLNIKMIKFCNKCGKTIHSNGLIKIKYCPGCGSSLSESEISIDKKE